MGSVYPLDRSISSCAARSKTGVWRGVYLASAGMSGGHLPDSDATASISISIFGSGSATTTQVVRAG